ncbi:DUF1310 family protein [Companilactobacillus mishanensis]|uniref:DUF1310 family protein n=1 Tax=Companilactobacillus mishanensis TaxID=2486008 RepID=A0A5P0ZK41_9LACO|nr:DUF1310 family protein [Companilactobacillus mishanensis]MQS53365.1 DUF1310 family protein [Companilactobacillus mishanensis]
MSKKRKITLLTVLAIILVIVIGGIGMKMRLDATEKEKMVTVVKANKHLIYDDFLSDIDKYHKINSVQVDYSTVKANPMGGIDVKGYVNKNTSLSFQTGFDSPDGDGTDVELSASVFSKKLDDFVSNKGE